MHMLHGADRQKTARVFSVALEYISIAATTLYSYWYCYAALSLLLLHGMTTATATARLCGHS
eukprot:scaffold667749_cov57-Prasinocladus_malaysianus.AAC.1